jgi:TPM domain
MVCGFRFLALAIALTACLVLATTSAAVTPEIRDDGKFFSPAALKKADERIRDIYKNHERDVLIETFTMVSRDDAEKVKGMDAKARSEYFLTWAKERVKSRAVNGVYVLLCKEPRHLLVAVVEKAPHKFPDGTQAVIEDVLRKEFRENRFDEGLDLALKAIEERLTRK